MARASWLLAISCCLAEIPCFWMSGLRSRLKRFARLRYADLPSSSGLFPLPLLDSALTKMLTASNDALVQWTLHPPKIPRKSSAGPVKAGSSSTSSADRGGTSPVVPRSQSQVSMAPSSSSSQQGRKRRGRKSTAPFSSASGGSGRSGGRRKRARKKSS